MEGSEHPYRLSDAERDDALVRLRVAFEEGRLDIDEHEARSSLAVRAVTSTDLVPLFDDLPSSGTTAVPAPRPEPEEVEPSGQDCKATAKNQGAYWWAVLPWTGFVFLFWGLPAVMHGSTEAIVGWSIFLAIMIVPHVVMGVVRHRRRPT